MMKHTQKKVVFLLDYDVERLLQKRGKHDETIFSSSWTQKLELFYTFCGTIQGNGHIFAILSSPLIRLQLQ